jgi:Transposase IS116/IS110/IS902 family.
MQEYINSLEYPPENNEYVKSGKRRAKKNMISIDIEKYAYSLWGVNLTHIPGISDAALLRLIGELGHDFTSKFNTYKEFCCWANITPNNKISGGKLLSSKVPKRKNQVGLILRSSANALKGNKSLLGSYFRKIQARNGYIPAMIATANKLGRIIYTLVKNKIEFDETFTNYR